MPYRGGHQKKKRRTDCPTLRFPGILLLRLFTARSLRLRDSPVLLADFEAGEAPDGDVLTELADLGGNQLRDADSLLLDKRLIQQANLLVEL